MKSCLLALAAIAAFACTATAHASAVDSFDINGAAPQLTGSFTYDFSSGPSASTGTVTFNDGTAYIFNASTDLQGYMPDFPDGYGAFLFQNASGNQLVLGIEYMPIAPFVPDVYALCSAIDPCSNGFVSGFTADFSSSASPIISVQDGWATIDPIAATPEPSSIALLGTGLLGFAGVARRRFLRA